MITKIPSALVFLGAVSLLLSLALTPLVRNVFRWLGIVDKPDNRRKLHATAVPRAGGPAIIGACALSYLLLMALPGRGGPFVEPEIPMVWQVLAAASIAFTTGLLDDIFGLKPWQKLTGQAAAACVAFALGIQVTGVAGLVIPIWLGLPITVIWLIACCNAFNLIDGVDGLACGAGIFATLTILTASLITKNVGLAVATVTLSGALLGFLRYNSSPASVFLGDSGTLTAGFMLGCFGVVWSYKATTLLAMMAPVLALSLPLLDTVLAIFRRILRREPIFSADRGHIHHRLLDRGMSPRRVVGILYATCILAAGFSLLLTVLQRQFAVPVVVAFAILMWFGINRLGYIEFTAARKIITGGELPELVRNRVLVSEFETSLAEASTAEDVWWALQAGAAAFGYSSISLTLDGRTREQRLNGAAQGVPSWEVRVPFGGTNCIVLEGPVLAAERSAALDDVVRTIHYVLSNRWPAAAKAAAASSGS